jgi:hypothetical protein
MHSFRNSEFQRRSESYELKRHRSGETGNQPPDPAQRPADPAPFLGFSSERAVAEHELEARFQSLPSADAARVWHRAFTAEAPGCVRAEQQTCRSRRAGVAPSGLGRRDAASL